MACAHLGVNLDRSVVYAIGWLVWFLCSPQRIVHPNTSAVRRHAHEGGHQGMTRNDFLNFYDSRRISDESEVHRRMRDATSFQFGSSHGEDPHAAVMTTFSDDTRDLVENVRSRLLTHCGMDPGPITRLFLQMDSQRMGHLSFAEIHYGLTRLGIHLTATQVVRIFSPFDR